MTLAELGPEASALDRDTEDDGSQVGLVDMLIWLGEGKRLIAIITVLAGLASLAYAYSLTPIFTARTTLLPPAAQQQSGSAAALAALGPLGGLAGGMTSKTPDELYVALLKSDSVARSLDERFNLRKRYGITTYEALRKVLPGRIRVLSEKKTGVVSIDVDDADPAFAADLANAHASELTKILDRLAVSEAQQRRKFFEQQLKDTKEQLIGAEQEMRRVQEKSGVIVLDKQAEALISSAAQLRAMITEREVQLKVLRTGATEENQDVKRTASEVKALRVELARMESSQGGSAGSAVDMPVGKIPEAAIDYVRARREVKLQETLLESMVRQFEMAKLDEAKEGQVLQQIDVALPPDYKSKPAKGLIALMGTLIALLASSAWVIGRRYAALSSANDPARDAAWQAFVHAWGWRR